MIILIAESKTMRHDEETVDAALYQAHRPMFEEKADAIMEDLKDLSAGELASILGLSATLARKMQKSVYEFGYKSMGMEAIEAFTGVVFKALDYPSLDAKAKERCNRNVRIISSLYGWLRPDDVVKPYRLDFTTRPEEGIAAEKSLNLFWRQDVTKALVRLVQEENETEILNLLPADAAKCIDWKLAKRFAKVWKVDFSEVKEGGVMKTPSAGRLKELRGKLLRQILEEGVKDAKGVMSLAGPAYVCEGNTVYPDHLQFLC